MCSLWFYHKEREEREGREEREEREERKEKRERVPQDFRKRSITRALSQIGGCIFLRIFNSNINKKEREERKEKREKRKRIKKFRKGEEKEPSVFTSALWPKRALLAPIDPFLRRKRN